MIIKDWSELNKLPPESVEDLVLWVLKPETGSEIFWETCYKILKVSGRFYFICDPENLEAVCCSLTAAGFSSLEMKVWSFKEDKESPGWFLPSWRAVILATKNQVVNPRVSLVSIFQKPSINAEKRNLHVGDNETLWGDLILIHQRECEPDKCSPMCPVFYLDANRTVPVSKNFQKLLWREQDLLDCLEDMGTSEGEQSLQSFNIKPEDFEKTYVPVPSIIAQGSPEKIASKAFENLKPGGFYFRISSEKDPIGVGEDFFLREVGFQYLGRLALIFEAGVCFYTNSQGAFKEFLPFLKLTREASVIGKLKNLEITSSRLKKSSGGICAMFGSGA